VIVSNIKNLIRKLNIESISINDISILHKIKNRILSCILREKLSVLIDEIEEVELK
jgi:hypothetical protein